MEFLAKVFESAVERNQCLWIYFMKAYKIPLHSNYFILQCADNVHTDRKHCGFSLTYTMLIQESEQSSKRVILFQTEKLDPYFGSN